MTANVLLTVAEMDAAYESEWILIDDPVTDESQNVQAGRVLAHSKDRDEVYRAAAALRPARFAILYTGSAPANTAIVL
jgi:hypothetical protein